jgi:hypothetical protein
MGLERDDHVVLRAELGRVIGRAHPLQLLAFLDDDPETVGEDRLQARAPRAISDTSARPTLSIRPTYPPMAPAPKTQIFLPSPPINRRRSLALSMVTTSHPAGQRRKRQDPQRPRASLDDLDLGHARAAGGGDQSIR